MSDIAIKPLQAEHENEFLKFADLAIGKDYFDRDEFKEILRLSTDQNGRCASFVLTNPDQKVLGMRLSYLPGRWLDSFGTERCMTHLWSVASEQAGYFKSLFLAPELRGRGLGPLLSTKSIEVLKQAGCDAVVTHSWKESPNNSSQRYLKHFGFKKIGEHPQFWSHIDYQCTRCGRPPCQCTAVEMIYYVNN